MIWDNIEIKRCYTDYLCRSSLIKRRMPPPWEFLSYLDAGACPPILNCVCGKEGSNFVSKTIRMSVLSFTILDNIEFVPNGVNVYMSYKNPIFTLFILIFFKISNVPSSQLFLIVLKVSVDSTGFKSKSHFG